MLCPDCKGEKEIKVLPKLTKQGKVICTLPCDRCKQTGKVPNQMAEWIKLGSYLREQRRKAKLTLRDFAKKVGVSELLLSNAERGIIDPMEFANVVFDNIAKKG